MTLCDKDKQPGWIDHTKTRLIENNSQYKLSHEVTDLIWVYIRVMQVDMHGKKGNVI